MDVQVADAVPSKSKVMATIRLGSEVHFITKGEGSLSEQLVSMKEQSMIVLKDFISKYNIPNDVPDEPLEGSSEDETEESEKVPGRPKKRK